MSLYKIAIHNLPRPLLIRASYVFRLFASILYRGNNVECPICKKQFSKFLPYGSNRAYRENVLCPNCLSLERHRLLWIYLNQKTSLFTAPNRFLHMAPEQCFHKRFKKLKNIEYITGDLESPLADHHFDLHDIPFESNSFDVVMCNHVLEHVNDADKCISELHRVLKPGGWAIMQVPIDYSRNETYEDPAIVSPEDREEHFWQKDHLRLFGKDYPDKLRKAGFSVREDDFVNTIGPDLRERFKLQKEEVIYYATK